MTSLKVEMILNPGIMFESDPYPSTFPQVCYGGENQGISSESSYTPPDQWIGQINNVVLPVPGPNPIIFSSNNSTDASVNPSSPIGTVYFTFNSTNNTTSGDLYYTNIFLLNLLWPGGIISSITLNTSPGTFNGNPVYIRLTTGVGVPSPGQILIINDIVSGSTTASYTQEINIPSGTLVTLIIPFLNNLSVGGSISSVSINGMPQEGIIYQGLAAFASVQGPCLHGGSLVSTPQGLKRMDQLTVQDQVLTSSGEYAPINEICRCWIAPGNGLNAYQALVIEKDALGSNLPDAQVILDPGHPIGIHPISLKPAGSYAEGNDKIYYTLWSDVELTREKTLTRYDLILEEPYHDYMVHNLVVRSRKSSKEAGYEHWYQDHY